MTLIFRPRANALARAAILAAMSAVAGAMVLGFLWVRSDYAAGRGQVPPQPVPFSHKHHVGGLGLDCRYCHGAVEYSAVAGLPPTETCMTCHSQLWTQAPLLDPVRESWQDDRPLRWKRVHDLPDFVYFNHSIHLNKGIGCVSCHGRVDLMPAMQQTATLFMSWCLECHRAPERFVRPREHVFDMAWQTAEPQARLGERLVKQYRIRVGRLTDCYICHR